MRWERVAVAVAVAVGLVGGVGAVGLGGFARSFVGTLDAGAVGFFLTATAVVWMTRVARRLRPGATRR
ncbi:hypothetical protein [Salinilacihabitans rarus]|uniref:hypothetical protein n=1 Tax=Salinilacihabitans rarus TaxID=2961596 RepID=UPI0020C917B9|nr:hypothetical protein [Salinilacihabitans rarus]